MNNNDHSARLEVIVFQASDNAATPGRVLPKNEFIC